MSDIKWNRFKITDPKLVELAENWLAERRAKSKELAEWLESFGASKRYGAHETWEFWLSGVEDVGQDRIGWRTRRDVPGFLFPDLRGNAKRAQREAGRKWKLKLESFRHDGPVELAKAIGAKQWMLPARIPGRSTACYMVSMHLSKMRGDWYVSIPCGVDWSIMIGLEAIKEWQYLKIEDEEKERRSHEAEQNSA